jgi:hypothetical protein
MSTPTTPNSPDPSAETEPTPVEAADVTHTDPTRELALDAPEVSPTEPVQDTVTEAADESPLSRFDEPASEPVSESATVWSEPQAAAPAAAPEPTAPEPKRPSGPYLPAILLGVVCLIVAVVAIAQELGRLTIDWGNVGPLGIVAAGAVLVVLGLVGLMTSRKS